MIVVFLLLCIAVVYAIYHVTNAALVHIETRLTRIETQLRAVSTVRELEANSFRALVEFDAANMEH